MVQRDRIVQYLHKLLNVDKYEDYCVNGIQVEGKKSVRKIVLGVSVSKQLFNRAIENKADMIIVHHGLFWTKDPSPYSLTGITRNRVAQLVGHDITLLGYHLPLDDHPELGNNAQILKLLNMKPVKKVDVGCVGKLRRAVQRDTFIKQVNKLLQTQAQVFPFGPEKIRNILVISGGSSFLYSLAVTHNADTFISGEIREHVVRDLEEAGINHIYAGHYNTERFGIQALGKKLKQKFTIPCEFVDIPNPV